MTTKKLNEFWASENFDLRHASECYAVGKIDPQSFRMGLSHTGLYRPRDPIAPAKNRPISRDLPKALRDLYHLARADMFRLGFDPDSLYLYLLHQSGLALPGQALREAQWHFDLMRQKRLMHDGKIPLVAEYGVSSAFPTVYATTLQNDDNTPLPAGVILQDTNIQKALGARAEKLGHIFQATAGEVVRYNNLVLHRGEPNQISHPVHKTFAHIAFCPQV